MQDSDSSLGSDALCGHSSVLHSYCGFARLQRYQAYILSVSSPLAAHTPQEHCTLLQPDFGANQSGIKQDRMLTLVSTGRVQTSAMLQLPAWFLGGTEAKCNDAAGEAEQLDNSSIQSKHTLVFWLFATLGNRHVPADNVITSKKCKVHACTSYRTACGIPDDW